MQLVSQGLVPLRDEAKLYHLKIPIENSNQCWSCARVTYPRKASRRPGAGLRSIRCVKRLYPCYHLTRRSRHTLTRRVRCICMDNLFSRDWDVPPHAYVLPVTLAALNIGVWITFSNSTGGMPHWALSWPEISSGRPFLLVSHMFGHGDLIHVALNVFALLILSPALISRLGTPLIASFRYTYLYLGSGLCGGGLFLLLNRGEPAAMLGASGAIFGVLAALARVHPKTGDAVAIRSRRTWLLAKLFVQNHIMLLVLLALIAFFADSVGGIAWEAHLGGLLFGFFAAPLYLPGDPGAETGEAGMQED